MSTGKKVALAAAAGVGGYLAADATLQLIEDMERDNRQTINQLASDPTVMNAGMHTGSTGAGGAEETTEDCCDCFCEAINDVCNYALDCACLTCQACPDGAGEGGGCCLLGAFGCLASMCSGGGS